MAASFRPTIASMKSALVAALVSIVAATLPSLQNGRAIGDFHHLVDIVRNEDDACAFSDDGAH